MKMGEAVLWEVLEAITRDLTGPSDHPTVMSSRVRVARNFEDIPFPHRMDVGDAETVLERVLAAAPPGVVVRMGDLTEIRRDFLVERHLISFECAETNIPKAIVVLPHDRVSIMINEEDHLRIQALWPGFHLKEARDAVSSCEQVLDSRLDFAFSEDLGYLTACPTNVGTGLRVSALLHLPALVATGSIGPVIDAVEAVGMMVRGFHGEGSDPSGNVFQFSTERTLGKSEERILSEASSVIQSVVEEEATACESLRGNAEARARIEEQIGHIVKEKAVTTEGALAALSLFLLARRIGIMEMDERQAGMLFFEVLPAHMQIRRGRLMTPRERDVERAAVLWQLSRSMHV